MVNYLKNETLGKHQKEIFIVLILAVLIIGIFYVYCLAGIMAGIVNHNNNLKNLQNMKMGYQELEKNYLSFLSKFDLDYVYSLGFVSENSLSYVTRQIPVAQNTSYENALR